MANVEPAETISTPLTRLFNIKHPIMLAGMNKAAGPKLAAAVTNAGGLGVIGGVGYTPRILRLMIKHLKKGLDDPNTPFGVDLLLPQVGGSARKTNYDYTKGKLDALIDVVIEEKATLFVSAVGVPPVPVVQRLHDAGILVMNMIGAPKHVGKALAVGVDIICAQGGEGGGHTGDVPTSILLPHVVDLCRGHVSPLTGEPVYVVGAGGIYDGRGLAMALSFGAQAVWVGTRFVASEEAGASEVHKEGVCQAGHHDTYRSLVYTGRPLRIIKNKYASGWQDFRQQEMKELLDKGVIPYTHDVQRASSVKKEDSAKFQMDYIKEYNDAIPLLCGQVAGNIREVLPARVIVFNMIREAIQSLRANAAKIELVSKL